MLLRAGNIDIATIALWLGHESTKTTRIYDTPTRNSKNKPSRGSPRSASSPADTAPPTR